jgi:hypothetical protein
MAILPDKRNRRALRPAQGWRLRIAGRERVLHPQVHPGARAGRCHVGATLLRWRVLGRTRRGRIAANGRGGAEPRTDPVVYLLDTNDVYARAAVEAALIPGDRGAISLMELCWLKSGGWRAISRDRAEGQDLGSGGGSLRSGNAEVKMELRPGWTDSNRLSRLRASATNRYSVLASHLARLSLGRNGRLRRPGITLKGMAPGGGERWPRPPRRLRQALRSRSRSMAARVGVPRGATRSRKLPMMRRAALL